LIAVISDQPALPALAAMPGSEVEGSSVISDQCSVISPLKGILRGLIHPGLSVTRGLKIGDVDPRDDPRLCQMVSDKALAVGGGVLEAILGRAEVRGQLWT